MITAETSKQVLKQYVLDVAGGIIKLFKFPTAIHMYSNFEFQKFLFNFKVSRDLFVFKKYSFDSATRCFRLSSRTVLTGMLGVFLLLCYNSVANAQLEWFQLRRTDPNPLSGNVFSGHCPTCWSVLSRNDEAVDRPLIVHGGDEYGYFQLRYQFITQTPRTPYPVPHFFVAERINEGAWTESAKYPGGSTKVNTGAPINADAIAMNIGSSSHGTWYVHGTGAGQHNQTQWFTFVPNASALKKVKEDGLIRTIDIRLKVVLERGVDGEHLKTREHSFRIVNLTDFVLAWQDNSDPRISVDGTSTYGEIDAAISLTPASSIPLNYDGKETDTDGTESPAGPVGVTEELSNKPGFDTGWDVPLGKEKFKYGFWVISRNSDLLFFRPNSVEINKLTPGQTVVSEVTITPKANNEATVADPQTLSVVITNTKIVATWNQGTLHNSHGLPEIIADPISSENFDIEGTISKTFLPIPEDQRKLNSWVFESFESRTDAGDTPIQASAITNWKPADPQKRDVITGFEGNETTINLSNRWGVWYVSSDRTKFLFRANQRNLLSFSKGESVKVFLRMSTGTCDGISICTPNTFAPDTKPIIVEAVVTVQKPVLSITTVNSTITTAQEAQFRISSDLEPPNRFVLTYVAENQSGNLLDEQYGASGSRRTNNNLQFTLNSNTNKYDAILTIPILGGGNLFVGSGEITVTLVITDDHASLPDSSSATITVTDQNDTISVGFTENNKQTTLSTYNDQIIAKVELSAGSVSYDIVVNYSVLPLSTTTASDFVDPNNGSITISDDNKFGYIRLNLDPDPSSRDGKSFSILLIGASLMPADGALTLTVINNLTTFTVMNTAYPHLTKSTDACDNHEIPFGITPQAQVSFNNLPQGYVEGTEFTTNLVFSDPRSGARIDAPNSATYYAHTIDINGNSSLSQVNVNAGQQEVPIKFEQQAGARGYARYQLIPRGIDPPHAYYKVGNPCEIEVWWVNNTRPGITLSIEKSVIRENQNFTLTATATPAPQNNIVVPITITNGHSLQSSTNINILINATQTSGSTTLRTTSVPVGQTSVPIGFQAVWDDDYVVHEKFGSESIDVIVAPPIIEFVSDSLQVQVKESDLKVDLGVSITTPISDDIQISLKFDGITATEDEDFIVPTSPVYLRGGRISDSISIPIVKDDKIEELELFTVTITGSSNENTILGTSLVSIISIIDSSQPSLSISALVDNITEGEFVVFIISSTVAPSNGDLQIPIEVTQMGNLINWVVPQTVTIKNNAMSTIFTIKTNDNTNSTSDGSISMRIMDVTGYAIDVATATITVRNSTLTDNIPKYSVASSVITKILLEIGPTNSPQTPASVQQKPTVQISTEKPYVNEGDTIYFKVSIESGIIQEILTVQIKLLEEGNFIGGETEKTVTLTPDHSTGTVSIATINDDSAEYDGTVSAVVQTGNGYVPATRNKAVVTVIDAVDRELRRIQIRTATNAILPDLSVTLGVDSLDLATKRVEQSFTETRQTKIELGGYSTLTGLLTEGGEILNQSNFDWRSKLGSSSVELSLFPDEGTAYSGTAWAYGDHMLVSNHGRARDVDWSGDVFTGRFGFDSKLSQKAVLGLSTTMIDADALYLDNSNNEYKVRTSSSGLYPYLGLSLLDGNFNLQTIAGYGTGQIDIDQQNYQTLIMDSNTYAAALGFNQRLNPGFELFDHTEELSISGKGWLVKQETSAKEQYFGDMSTSVHQMRLTIDGSKQFALQNGNLFTSSTFLGLRERTKNTNSSIDLEVGGEFHFENSNAWENTISSQVLFDGRGQIYEWGIQDTLEYNHGFDNQGLNFQLTTVWNETSDDDSSSLWNSNLTPSYLGSRNSYEELQFESKVSYGIVLDYHSSLLTPFGAFALYENGNTTYESGAKLKIESNYVFEISNSFKTQYNGRSSNKINIEGKVTW